MPQLEAMVERIVERKMLELLSDPDEGLELKPHIKARLRRSLAAMRRGERGIPAEQVAKELGLKW
ncbi:MAG: hypothetical protein FJ279_16900 [Planctomycetes bacterium]|nr:hypothetical protein [Planctomycetota bacterium]